MKSRKPPALAGWLLIDVEACFLFCLVKRVYQKVEILSIDVG